MFCQTIGQNQPRQHDLARVSFAGGDGPGGLHVDVVGAGVVVPAEGGLDIVLTLKARQALRALVDSAGPQHLRATVTVGLRGHDAGRSSALQMTVGLGPTLIAEADVRAGFERVMAASAYILGADVAAYASGAKGASEPSPEQLMRRLQIEFHRVRRG